MNKFIFLHFFPTIEMLTLQPFCGHSLKGVVVPLAATSLYFTQSIFGKCPVTIIENKGFIFAWNYYTNRNKIALSCIVFNYNAHCYCHTMRILLEIYFGINLFLAGAFFEEGGNDEDSSRSEQIWITIFALALGIPFMIYCELRNLYKRYR